MGKDQDLLEACRTGNISAIEKLLAGRLGSKANKGAKGTGGGALSSLSKSFMSLKSANVNCVDGSGDTPLHLAALNGHKDIVTLLLDCDASPLQLDTQDCSALHLAAWSGHTDICSQLLLLQEGQSQSLINLQTRDGNTALHFAAQHGHGATLSLLLQKKGDATIRNLEDLSPLDLAAQYDRLDIVRQLVMSHPALLAKRSAHHTPLHLASRNGHRAVVQYLLGAGFPVNATTDKGSALHEAANFCKLEVLKLLLEKGVDISIKSDTGFTAEDVLRSIPSKAAEDALTILKTHIYHQRTPDSDGEKSILDGLGEGTPPPPPIRSAASTTSATPTAPENSPAPLDSVRKPASEKQTNLLMSLSTSTDSPPPIPPRQSLTAGIMQGGLPPLQVPKDNDDDTKLSASPRDVSPVSRSPLEKPKKPPRKKPSSFRKPELSPTALPPTEETGRDGTPLVARSDYTNLDPLAAKMKMDMKTAADGVGNENKEQYPVPNTNCEYKDQSSNTTPPPPAPVAATTNRLSHPPPQTLDIDRPITDPSSSCDPTAATTTTTHPVSPSKLPQPPTPDCPPPSPSTAIQDIHRQIQMPMEKRKSQDVETLTDPPVENNAGLLSAHRDQQQQQQFLLSSDTSGTISGKILTPVSEEGNLAGGMPLPPPPPPPPPPHTLSHAHPTQQQQQQQQQQNDENENNTPMPMPPLPPPSALPPPPHHHHHQQQHQHHHHHHHHKTANPVLPVPPPPTHPPPPHPNLTADKAVGVPRPLPKPAKPQPLPRKSSLSALSVDLYPQSPSSINSTDSSGSGAIDSVAGGCYSTETTHQQLTNIENNNDNNVTNTTTTTNSNNNNNNSNNFNNNLEGYGGAKPVSSSQQQQQQVMYGSLKKQGQILSASSSSQEQQQQQQHASTTTVDNDNNNTRSSTIIDVMGEKVEMRRPISSNAGTHPPDWQGHVFADLLRGSVVGGARDVVHQLCGNKDVSVASLKKKRKSTALSQFRTVMEEDKDIDPDQLMSEIDNIDLSQKEVKGSNTEEDEVFDDDSEEWAQITATFEAFGVGLSRESVFVTKHLDNFTKFISEGKDKGESKLQSVGEWLTEVGLPQYENTLVANGFDDTDFLGGRVMEEQDLCAIGMDDPSHRQLILEGAAKLLEFQPLDLKKLPESVAEWLGSLRLDQYLDTFMSHGYSTMERVVQLWELELVTVLDITSVGHRKRILASLGERRPEVPTSPAKPRITSFDGLREPKSPFDHVDLYRDYTGVRSRVNKDQESDLPQGSLDEFEDTSQGLSQGQSIRDQAIHIRAPHMMQYTGSIKQWRHKPEILIKGCCNYTAHYLGSTLVKELKGAVSTQEGIAKLKKSSEVISKIPSIMLSISFKGVKFIDSMSKRVVCDHEIANIFCACQDAEHMNFFAYITKDREAGKHYCHVFSVRSRELAGEIILTLGEAFEIAYQMVLKEKAETEAANFEKQTTSSTTSTSSEVQSGVGGGGGGGGGGISEASLSPLPPPPPPPFVPVASAPPTGSAGL